MFLSELLMLATWTLERAPIWIVWAHRNDYLFTQWTFSCHIEFQFSFYVQIVDDLVYFRNFLGESLGKVSLILMISLMFPFEACEYDLGLVIWSPL